MRNRWMIVLLAVAALLLAACPAATPAPAESGEAAGEAAEGDLPYDGVEVNLLTFTGPQIAEPLQRRAPDFEALTGAKVNVVVVPFSDLYQKVLVDMATSTNAFDAFVFAPQWMVDYIGPGYVEVLTDRIAADSDLEWDDVAPFFRDFSSTFEGDVYTIPLDGDFQMAYYRSDILEELGLSAPVTWDDYLAESVSRRTRKETRRRFRRLNEVGEPDYARATIQTAGKDTDTLLRLHDLRWDEVGGSAFFDRRDRATIRSFNYAAAARGWLRLVTLSIDGEPVSSELARRLGDRQTHGGRDQARLPRGAECWREAHDPGFALVRPGNEIAHKSRAWTSSD